MSTASIIHFFAAILEQLLVIKNNQNEVKIQHRMPL